MTKLNVVLSQVMTKLGIDTTTQESQKLLGNPNLSTIDVSDDVATRLNADFFTKEAAVQNPEIRSQIKAEVLNGIDAQTKDLMSRYELDVDSQNEILKEDKSGKRLSKMVDKIAELTRSKSKASGEDKETLNREIEKLNKQIVETRNDYESKVTELNKGRKMDRLNWELDSIYNGLDYSLAMDKDLSTTAAKSVISKIAESKGLRFETTEAGIQILTKEGTEYFENNSKVNPSDFIKKSLMENKMIKVAEVQTQATPSFKNNAVQPSTYKNQNSDWNSYMAKNSEFSK